MSSKSSSSKGGKSFLSLKKSVVLSPKNVIRLDIKHKKALEKLIDPKLTTAMFGEFDLEEVLTKCYLALGIQDDDNKIVGAIVLNLHPNVPALPPWEWDHWIYNMYGLKETHSRNTLWIQLLVWDHVYYFLFLRPLVQGLFVIRNFLEYCILVVPPGKQRTDFLCGLGTAVMPKDCPKHNSCQYLYIFRRSNFTISYKIRRAVEEDNDDLVPLIETHSTRLQECYGSYYVAEILTRQSDVDRQLIVAEYQGTAVAVLCLHGTVNYKVLNEEFELSPYNGLKKPHPDDFEDLSADDIRQSLEQLQSRVEDEIIDIIDQRSSQLSRKSSEEEIFLHVSRSDSDQYSLVFTSGSLFFFQDDEDKDQEIIGSEESEDSNGLLSQYLEIHEKDQKFLEMDWVSGYSASKGKIQRIPEFHGEPNAFALEIAASLPEHEYGLIKLFEACFECFPDRDYCVLSVPSTTPINKLTKYFCRVVPRSSGCFPYELYVMHKNTVLADMTVKVAGVEHEKQVKALISTIPNYPMVLQQFESSLYLPNSSYYAFVMLCQDQAVGVAIVAEEFDLPYLNAHYDLFMLDSRVHKVGSHGVIESILMSQIFQRHAKYFLRELHRLSDFSVLYYRHTPYDTTEAYRERPLLNVLQNLLPILPRKQPNYDMKVLKSEECAPADIVIENQEPFALYLSTVKLCSVNRQCINTRIVVVGCSNTSLAFLEMLLFNQSVDYMITFNNVTLISPNSMSYAKVASKVRDSFMVKKNFMDARYMDMISFKTYVNFVQGKVTNLDRKEQLVVINNNSYANYDLLMLMNGEQFQMPVRSNRVPFQEKPDNVFIINHIVDANNAVVKLKHLHNKFKDPDYVIIIYGHFLQAHATMHGLLSFGVPGNHMVYIEPFPYSMTIEKRHRHNVSIYNDPDIDQTIYDHIKDEGITIYSSYYFIDWTYDPSDNIITMAKFESRHKMLEMECLAMFFFNEKEVSPRVYRVINNAGLVYDGRLVVDNKNRTNDPKIYGAGTVTKYSRKYYAPNMTAKYFNRVEIGHRLGMQIKSMLVPQKVRDLNLKENGWNFHIERGKYLVPRYVKPIMRYCRLPGSLYYLSVTKPGRRIPLETAIAMENYGQVLITGGCRNLNKQGFFQLHLNEFERVETITCLTKFPIDIYNIYCLWGKHEKMLNNIALRFEMVLITDLFDYFKEPWAYALYHDKFDYLLDDLNMLMTSSVGVSGHSIINDLITLYKQHKWNPLSTEANVMIEEKFRALAYPKIIEQKLLDFIKENLDYLTMYAHPVVIRALLRNYENSPLFS
ncbi:unnamed protein product [Phaedon cochleariae]|uniref:Cilia- and flagella-associated protein 61 N-terminal domain-containing protein n=1 Tax=Phaedon cochleariae TaxID=80249 RepID=A0A9P0GQC2_PHACE|nr:unnamed protein product [Phaedon cochleariae]